MPEDRYDDPTLEAFGMASEQGIDDRSMFLEEKLLEGYDPWDPVATLMARGGEAAHNWVVPAIQGQDVPEGARTEFSMIDVQGGHGSANIPLLQATCAAWFWHYRNANQCRAVLDAWRGYFDLDRWHTKEPYGCFRYRNWITLSYVAMHGLCVLRNETALADDFARYLRYMAFTAVLSAGWRRGNPGGSYGNRNIYPVAYGGSRSWVAPKDDNGHYVQRPYAGLTDWNGISEDFSDILGFATKSCWETEPVLAAMESQFGYNRWSMFSDSELTLMTRLVQVKTPTESLVADLGELVALIASLHVKVHISVRFIKTTEGTAWISERSWSSGSTSFKFGAIWDANGRTEGEYPESWASQIPREWGWLHEGGHARKSDPGGTGEVRISPPRLELRCRTGDGSCANGFTPGSGRYYDQTRGWVQDQRAWPNGDRAITLGGNILWDVLIKAKGRGIEVLVPDDGSPVDPPVEPPPVEPPPAGGCPPEPTGPGASDLIYAHDQLVRAMKNWGSNHQKAANQSRRAMEAISTARIKAGYQ